MRLMTQMINRQSLEDYMNEVCDIIGMPDVRRRAIMGDYIGEAAKYLNTSYGTIEREEITRCYNLGYQVGECASSVMGLLSGYGYILF